MYWPAEEEAGHDRADDAWKSLNARTAERFPNHLSRA
jgi:hypothetical protein